MIFSMINQGYGATLLTTEGMELHTLFRRRSVPWGEVAEIEERCLPARSGTRSEVRIVRDRGRALTVPGTLTARMHDPRFEAKLATIRQYRARAAGN
ncbi:PH domain-containing protein [Streptomyces sp. NPDC050388]|uniref:PH domain-containing protein n=1 Tax=Streptomyces sp. NPDC050388 TaxID=3155781 RepID=UPI0034483EE9